MKTVTHVSGQFCYPCIRWTEAGVGGLPRFEIVAAAAPFVGFADISPMGGKETVAPPR